jgi:hypothetical protein
MCWDLNKIDMDWLFIIQSSMRLFVTYFVRGLKFELQDVVQVQTPSTVDRAILLPRLNRRCWRGINFEGSVKVSMGI